MPRQRFIWPSIWTSENFLELTFRQRLLFIGMFSLADDTGRIKASPRTLKASIFPGDDISQSDIEEDLETLCLTKSISIYETEQGKIALFPSWKEFQKPKYAQPSKLPSTGSIVDYSNKVFKDPDKVLIPDNNNNVSPNASETFPQHSPNASETFPYGMGRVGVGRDGMDREGKNLNHVGNSISSDSDSENSPALNSEKTKETILEDSVEAKQEFVAPPKPKNGKSIWPKKQQVADLKREFEDLWQMYPKKEGKVNAEKYYLKWRKDYSELDFERSILNYRKKIERGRTEEKYIKTGATFFNGGFVDFIEGVPSSDIAGDGKKLSNYELAAMQKPEDILRNSGMAFILNTTHGEVIETTGKEV